MCVLADFVHPDPFSFWGGSWNELVLQVAPSCAIESGCTTMVERALSSACASRVYHPDGEGERRAPHLALWHEKGDAACCVEL